MIELVGWSTVQVDFRLAELPRLRSTLREAFGISLPDRVGDAAGGDALHALRIAPSRLWLVAESSATLSPSLVTLKRRAATTELTHGQRRYRLSGARLIELLAKGIALDFEDGALAPGRFAQTQLHRVPVLLHRLGGSVVNFHVPRSFAQSIEEWFADAALPLEGAAAAQGEATH